MTNLVLPTTNRDFTSLADEAADTLFRDGTNLTTSVADIAIREELNPTEVKRLTEKTNVIATVRMLKSSTDKKATIDLADYAEVMEKTHPKAEVATVDSEPEHEKTAVLREYKKVNALMGLDQIFKLGGQIKTAQEYKRPDGHVEVFKLRKSVEELKLKKVATEAKIKDGIDYLASEFSKYNGPDFTKFAAEALAVQGAKCRPVLDSLANYIRCKYDHQKTAEYIVNDMTPLHQKLAQVCENLVTMIRQEHEIDATTAQLADKWAKALRG